MNRSNQTPAGDAVDELKRIDALHRLAVLDTLPEPVFDAITAAAAQVCQVPIALVSLIDIDRQWFKSNLGLPGVAQTPRELAFCDHAIRDGLLFEVDDARLDARFAANPLVIGDPNIRFYAGAPIVMPGGERVGTVCVIDRQPRQLSDEQRAMLTGLSRVASASLVERSRQVAVTRALAESESRYRTIVEDQTELISLAHLDGTLTFVNTAYARHLGWAPERMIGRDLLDFVDELDRAEVQARLAAIRDSGAPASGVNRMRPADGRPLWVSWINRPLADETGRLIGLQSVGRDITEQRLAEQALARNEQRQRSLYESTPAMLHSVDAQGRLLNVSDLWLEVMGYEREEVIGKLSRDFLTPESAQRASEQVLPDFFRRGRCDRVEYQFVRKDGTRLDILLSAILEKDDSGAPLRSLAVLENVTVNKQLASELSRTHAHLDAIVENVPALLGHWDRDGKTLFANREFQLAMGLPRERIVGCGLEAIVGAVDPAAYAALAPHVDEVLQGRRQEFELPMRMATGQHQLRLTLVPDRPPSGEIAGYYGLAHDITARKFLEIRLRDSEQRYRSLFDHLNSGFALHELIVDARGRPADYRFLAMNAAYESMSGLASASTIGRLASDVLPPAGADSTDWVAAFGRVALSGQPGHFEQSSPLGDRCFELLVYRPAEGQFAVIAQDVTQRKQAEARLQEALKEKETLLKEVYHRVKNNLQVVQSLLNLQRRSVPEGAARSALEDSVRRVRAMALVHEKLYQSGTLSAVSLPEYGHDLLKQLGEATGATQRHIHLRADIAPMQIGLDSAIPFGLLMAELVSNALKHAFPTPSAEHEVRVELIEQGDAVQFCVSDNGIGLPEGFDPAASRSMGLQLAMNLARQIGGELRAASGPGAAFSARLTRLQHL